MKKKHNKREIKNENQKSKEKIIIEKTINLEKDGNIIRAKSPKSYGNIMKKLGLLNKFNKLFYEKENEDKRENSARNDFDRKTINVNRNIWNLKKQVKYGNKKPENINSNLKIIRHSSYCKFDNEESINRHTIEDSLKLEKENQKKIYKKKYSKDIKREIKEKENISINKEIRIRKVINSLNFNKKIEMDLNNKQLNDIFKKKNINENIKEISVFHMPDVQDFDKPIKNKKEKENEFSIISPKSSLKKSKYINDDILLKRNNSNVKESFQFLVNQAYKNREISNSFHKYYESHARSREQSIIKIDNNSIGELLTEKKNHSRNKKLKLLKSPNKSINNIISLKNLKSEMNQELNKQSRNIKTLNLNEKCNRTNYISSENHYIIKKVIINNGNPNCFTKNKNNNNETFNKKNISNSENNDNNSSAEGKKNICIKNYILINNLKVVNNKNNNKDKTKVKTMEKNYNFSTIPKPNIPIIYNVDLEIFYCLDEKMKIIINKVNNFQVCKNECYNYIQYYFSNQFYNKIQNFFSNNENILNYIKMEILCFFLCYDISSGSLFSQTAILLKTILNIIHSNYLILIYYIIELVKFNYKKNNNESLLKIIMILEKEPSIIQIKNKEINEYYILNIILNNLKNIIVYYKMVIDNVYDKYNNIKEEKVKFPNCIKNFEFIKSKLIKYKQINIISSFFYNSYKRLNAYDFIELQKFFNIFLDKNKVINNYIEKKPINSVNNNKIIYFLPKMKKCYKYSLVLDLDETLVSFQNNFSNYKINHFLKTSNTRLILRPGLNEFLKKMKQYYELILFSSGTSDYVDPIVNFIEKNEKYFEFVLYRQHISFDEKGEYFKNLHLLNRDIKNILIIDDKENNFKYHKANGICIKPFYGDYEKDRNILNLLGQILIKIRINADEFGDIRISLNNEKNNLNYSKVAINLNNKEYNF